MPCWTKALKGVRKRDGGGRAKQEEVLLEISPMNQLQALLGHPLDVRIQLGWIPTMKEGGKGILRTAALWPHSTDSPRELSVPVKSRAGC